MPPAFWSVATGEPPCPDGTVQWSAYGHTGGSSQVLYAPAEDLAVALFVSDSIYEPEGRYDAVQGLLDSLRTTLRRS